MAHSLSAKKRIRQNAKRHAHNRRRQVKIKRAERAFSDALHAGDLDTAEQQLREVYKSLDRVADKGTIHKNAAARKKSRLARRLAAARG